MGEISSQPLQLLMSVVILVLISLTAVNGETLYTKYHGYRIASPCISGVHSSVTLAGCVARCSQTSTCISGSYTLSSGVCCVSDSLIYLEGVSFLEDPDSVYFQTEADVAWHGNWALVFRGTAGNGQSVYTEYLDSSKVHDNPVGGANAAISCWSLSGSHSCPVHLRSSLLNQWANGALNVQRVQFSLYKDGAEVVNIIFNGVGSNPTNWFLPSNVLSSTYTDLTPTQTYNYFSVYGVVDPNADRKFYVSRSHAGCENDIGYIAIVEKATCNWESLGTPYPYFLYSTSTTSTQWQAGPVGQADVMAIFVEL